MSTVRVTVTLPPDTVEEIDRFEPSRSRFVAEAVKRELKRRWRLELRCSLLEPHPQISAVAAIGLGAWAASLPRAEAADLLDLDAGRPIRWVQGVGWTEGG